MCGFAEMTGVEITISTAIVRQMVAVRFSYGKFRTEYLGRTRWNGGWVEFYSTPFVFLTDAFTGEFLCGRYPSHNYLLKSLRVAIATNHISLNFPHKDGSLRKRWYLSIPQLVLIIFGLDIVFNTSKKHGNGPAECGG